MQPIHPAGGAVLKEQVFLFTEYKHLSRGEFNMVYLCQCLSSCIMLKMCL